MINLFQTGNFTLSSGQKSSFKIECDALIEHDWQTIAKIITSKIQGFKTVTGIPTGGTHLAELLQNSCKENGHYHLIVDDVFTTGQSILKMREQLLLQQTNNEIERLDIIGVVLFARNQHPPWIMPIFQYWFLQDFKKQ